MTNSKTLLLLAVLLVIPSIFAARVLSLHPVSGNYVCAGSWVAGRLPSGEEIGPKAEVFDLKIKLYKFSLPPFLEKVSFEAQSSHSHYNNFRYESVEISGKDKFPYIVFKINGESAGSFRSLPKDVGLWFGNDAVFSGDCERVN